MKWQQLAHCGLPGHVAGTPAIWGKAEGRLAWCDAKKTLIIAPSEAGRGLNRAIIIRRTINVLRRELDDDRWEAILAGRPPKVTHTRQSFLSEVASARNLVNSINNLPRQIHGAGQVGIHPKHVHQVVALAFMGMVAAWAIPLPMVPAPMTVAFTFC